MGIIINRTVHWGIIRFFRRSASCVTLFDLFFSPSLYLEFGRSAVFDGI
jgi:hypothetical protein